MKHAITTLEKVLNHTEDTPNRAPSRMRNSTTPMTTDLPPGLPPLPPVPAGFDRWEYRGTEWKDQRKTVYATTNTAIGGAPTIDDWSLQSARPMGARWLHYIEAVREPAEVPASGEAMSDRRTTDEWKGPLSYRIASDGGAYEVGVLANPDHTQGEWVKLESFRDLERKLAVASEALEWAQSQLGKHTRPSPIDKALDRLKEIKSNTEPPKL